MVTFTYSSYSIDIINPLQNILLLVVLILLTVAAYFFLVYFRGKRATHFGNLKTLERVHGFRRFYLSPVVLGVKIFIISLLFLTATESIELRKVSPVTDTDFMLLIDSSSSMAKQDYNPNRLAAAKDISRSWLRVLPNQTKVGAISFAQRVNNFVAPTTDKGRVRNTIDNAAIDYSQSGTSLDLALSTAFDLFEPYIPKKAVLLFTDGTDDVDPLILARAKDLNIKIYAFGIGSSGEDIELPDDIPEDFKDLYTGLELNFTKLSDLAESTGGQAYQIENADDLLASFQDVTLEDIQVRLNSTYYIVLLISLLSILELLLYARFGAL